MAKRYHERWRDWDRDTICLPPSGSRLYFDYDRSRLFDSDGRCFDFSWFNNYWVAQRWCELEGVEFVDNRLQRLPEFLHVPLLAARKAASARVEHLLAYGHEGKRGRSKKWSGMESWTETEDGRILWDD